MATGLQRARRRVRGSGMAAVVCLVFVISGCGATKTITQTVGQRQTQTTTVVHHVPAPPAKTDTLTRTATAPSSSGGSSSRGGYASTYPLTFESSFDQSCINAGSDLASCSCSLKYIEQHVSYETVLAAGHDIFTGNPPSWFTDAKNQCTGL